MKTDYKNWMPKGMVVSFLGAAILSFLLLLVLGIMPVVGDIGIRRVLGIVFAVITIILGLVSLWMFLMYRAFSYDGSRQMSKQIIEGIAEYVKVPDGGKCLDVGCGSGALTIACAKRNPKALLVGIDRWGKEYASFSKKLCENNSVAEGVNNTSFQQGDATRLPFEDGTFDAVTSNYVYHNIPSKNRQEILLETLRTLKKGGTFAIHDIMSKGRYGDMQKFVNELYDEGYEKVRLIDTTDGKFMSKWESRKMMLAGSSLLVGVK